MIADMNTPKTVSTPISSQTILSDIDSSKSRHSGVPKKTTKVPIRESYYSLFNKGKELRTPHEKRRLVRVIESLRFFNKETLSTIRHNHLMNKLLDSFKYEEIPAAQPIYHEGDPANRFYIVLKGRVRLYGPRSNDEIEEDRSRVSNHSANTPISTRIKSSTLNTKKAKNSTPHTPAQEKPNSYRSTFTSTFAAQQQAKIEKITEAQSPTKEQKGSMATNSPYYRSLLQTASTLSDKIKVSTPKQQNMASLTNALLSLNTKKNDSGSKNSSKNSPMLHNTQSKLKEPKMDDSCPTKPSAFRSTAFKLSVVTRIAQKSGILENADIINQRITSEDQQILLKISKPTRKYVLNHGVCAFEMQQEISAGDSFGDIAHKSNARKETAVAIDRVHIISLPAQDYLELFEEPIKERRERIEIFRRLFSSKKFEDPYLVKFADLFQVRKYELKDKIFYQGETSNGLYMVRDGEVRLVRTDMEIIEASSRRLQKSVPKQMEVARLRPYQFFGADQFLGLETRGFTAETASITLEMLFLDASFLKEPFYYSKEFLSAIARMTEAQGEWEANHLEKMRENTKKYSKNLASLQAQPNYILKRELRPDTAPASKDTTTTTNNTSQPASRLKFKRLNSAKPVSQSGEKSLSNINLQDSYASTYRISTPRQGKLQESCMTLSSIQNDMSMSKSTIYQSQDRPSTRPVTASLGELPSLDNRLDVSSLTLFREGDDSMPHYLKIVRQKPAKDIKEDEKKPPLPNKTSLWKYNAVALSQKDKNRRLRHQNDPSKVLSASTYLDKNNEANKTLDQSRDLQKQNVTTTQTHNNFDLRNDSREHIVSQSVNNLDRRAVSRERFIENDRDQFAKKKLNYFLDRMKNDNSKRFNTSGNDSISILDKYSQQMRSTTQQTKMDTSIMVDSEPYGLVPASLKESRLFQSKNSLSINSQQEFDEPYETPKSIRKDYKLTTSYLLPGANRLSPTSNRPQTTKAPKKIVFCDSTSRINLKREYQKSLNDVESKRKRQLGLSEVYN